MNNKSSTEITVIQQPIILNAEDLSPEYIERIRNDALLMDVAYQKHDINADIETKRKHYREKILSNDSYNDAHKHFLLNQVQLKEAWNRDSGLQGLVFETADVCIVALSGTGSGFNIDTFQDIFKANIVETAVMDGKPVTQIVDCFKMFEKATADGILPKNKEIKIIGHSLGGNLVFNIKHHLGRPVVSVTLHSAGKITSLKDHLKKTSNNKGMQQTIYQVLTAARVIAPLSEFVAGTEGKEKLVKEIATMQRACKKSLDKIKKDGKLPTDPNHVHLANKNGISFLNEMGDLSAGMIINVPGDSGHGIASFVDNCDRLLKQHKDRDIAVGHGTQIRSLKLLASSTLMELNNARKNNDNPLERAAIEKDITRCKKAINVLGGDEELLYKESYTMIMHYLHKGEPLAGISEKEQKFVHEYVESIKNGSRVQQRRAYGLLLSSTEQRLIKERKIQLLPKDNYQSGYVKNQSVIRNMEIRYFKSRLIGQTEENISQLEETKQKKLMINEARRNTLAQYAPENTEIIEALDSAIDIGKRELQAIKNHRIWNPSKKKPVMPLSELPEAKKLSKIDQDNTLSPERKKEAKKQLYKQVIEEIAQNDKANAIMEHQAHIAPEMLDARKGYNKAKKQFASGLAKDVGKEIVRSYVLSVSDTLGSVSDKVSLDKYAVPEGILLKYRLPTAEDHHDKIYEGEKLTPAKKNQDNQRVQQNMQSKGGGSSQSQSSDLKGPKMKAIEEKQILLEKTKKDIVRLDKKIASLQASPHVNKEMLDATIKYREMQMRFQSKLQKDIAKQQRSYYQSPSIDFYDIENRNSLKTFRPMKQIVKDLESVQKRFLLPYYYKKYFNNAQELPGNSLGGRLFNNNKKGSFSKHIVTKNQNLSVIAKMRNTTVDQLVEDNNITNPDKIQEGQVLIVRNNQNQLYEIQEGENLTGIAKTLNTTVDRLVEENNIKNPDDIKAGGKLKVPNNSSSRSSQSHQNEPRVYEPMDFDQIDNSSNSTAEVDSGGGSSYTIQPGDSLSEISEKTGVDMDDLIEDNGITDPDKIHAGEDLYIRDKKNDDSSIRSYQESDIYKQFIPGIYLNPDWRSFNLQKGDKVPFIGSRDRNSKINGKKPLYGPQNWLDHKGCTTAADKKVALLEDRFKKGDKLFTS